MITHANPRFPVTHRTATTAQRLRHKTHHEQRLDWGSIFKMTFILTGGMLAVYVGVVLFL